MSFHMRSSRTNGGASETSLFPIQMIPILMKSSSRFRVTHVLRRRSTICGYVFAVAIALCAFHGRVQGQTAARESGPAAMNNATVFAHIRSAARVQHFIGESD